MGPPSGLFAELSKWRDKAVKRGKVTPFNSTIIPDWLNVELVAAQEVVGPDAAFSFLKQVPLPVRMKAEREIKRKVQAILAKYEGRAARSIKRGEEFDYAGMADELRAAVMPEISSLVLDSALRLSVDTGISFDPSVINTEALRWAREYSYDLVSGLTNTTRNQIAEATSAFVQTPGMTIGDIERLIEPSFGTVRAQMIAVTETTRAYSMGTNEIQELLRRETPELETTLVLNTMQDELVCPICGPLEGAPKREWGAEFPNGPPLHVNCRCSTSIRFETPEQLETEFGTRQAEREAWLREQGLWKEPVGIATEGEIESGEAQLMAQASFARVQKLVSLPDVDIKASSGDFYGQNGRERGTGRNIIEYNLEAIQKDVANRAITDLDAWTDGTRRDTSAILDHTIRHESGHVWRNKQWSRALSSGEALEEVGRMDATWERLYNDYKADMPLYSRSVDDPEEAFADLFARRVIGADMPNEAITSWFDRWVK